MTISNRSICHYGTKSLFMGNRIIYIGNYDHFDTGHKLLTQPSGCSKMNYILNALVEAGFIVDLYSTAVCDSSSWQKRQTYRYNNFTINYLFSIGHQGLFRKVISFLLIIFQLIFILSFVKNDISILVYHSPRLTKYLLRFRFLYKRNPLYLEIEELYSVVRKEKKKAFDNEIKRLQSAQGYILVNDTIKQLCDLNAQSTVCYGVYTVLSILPHHIQDDSVNIVYAGGLDEDAILAIHTISLLPSKYTLHILGWGKTKDDIERVKNEIERINKQSGKIRVTYEGCLHGKDYEKFLDTNIIGLSSREVEKLDSQYAFPSKILTYLAHNLIVVSTPHIAIQRSKIADLVYFSSDFKPESIADAIEKSMTKMRIVDNKERIIQLHKQFVSDLKQLFHGPMYE